MKRLIAWWKFEKGMATISLFILGLPLIIGVFGFGFDEARALYIKGYLQNRATLAVQSALASSTNTDSNGNLYIDPNVYAQVYNNYEDNTSSYRSNGTILTCATSSIENNPIQAGECGGDVTTIGIPGTLADYCKPVFGGAVSSYGLQYQVKEQVDTVFLRILGINTLTLSTIDATALLRPACP